MHTNGRTLLGLGLTIVCGMGDVAFAAKTPKPQHPSRGGWSNAFHNGLFVVQRHRRTGAYRRILPSSPGTYRAKVTHWPHQIRVGRAVILIEWGRGVFIDRLDEKGDRVTIRSVMNPRPVPPAQIAKLFARPAVAVVPERDNPHGEIRVYERRGKPEVYYVDRSAHPMKVERLVMDAADTDVGYRAYGK